MRDFASSDRPFHDIKVTFPLTESQVFSLLTSALEGGSNHWIDQVVVDGVADDAYRFLQDVPLMEGGALWITSVDDSTPRRLDWESIVRGLIAMSKGSPRHFFDIVMDDADMVTADVFLQYCLFGDAL